jgi:hypothetical protein
MARSWRVNAGGPARAARDSLRSVANICNQEHRPRPRLSVNGPRYGVEIYLLKSSQRSSLDIHLLVHCSRPVRERLGRLPRPAALSFRASTPLTQTSCTRLRADWTSRTSNGPEWRRSYRRFVLPNTVDARTRKPAVHPAYSIQKHSSRQTGGAAPGSGALFSQATRIRSPPFPVCTRRAKWLSPPWKAVRQSIPVTKRALSMTVIS